MKNDTTYCSAKRAFRTTHAGPLRFCWKNPARAPRLTIASAESPREGKADFWCDGAADEAVINAALAALPEGGEAILLPGTYRLDSRIALRRRGTALRGGRGSVLVREFYDYPGEHGMVALLAEQCGVHNLRLEGLWQGEATGYEESQCALAVYAGGASITGVDICGTVALQGGSARGMDIRADGCLVENCRVAGCFAPHGEAAGIRIRGGSVSLSGNTVSGNFAVGRCRGIDAEGCGCRMSGNRSFANLSASGDAIDVSISSAGR